MDDLISRQAAIDALCNMHCGCTISDCPLNYEEDGAEECADVRWLMGLPSAQPELLTEIQEILNYLDTTLHPIVSPDNWNVYSELYDMVSKLPSAKPNVHDRNVGDMISKQAAVSRISDLLMLELKGQRLPTWDEVNEAINELPSAQPDVSDRKVGKWIVVERHEHYPSGKPYEQVQCPFCKRFDNNGDGSFCGYCGAEMVKGEEDERIKNS